MNTKLHELDESSLFVYALDQILWADLADFDTGPASPAIGRVYTREIDGAVKFSPWRFRPLEGGASASEANSSFLRLDKLAPVSLTEVQRLQLRAEAVINWGGRRVGLHLGNTSTAIQWPGNRAALRSAGLEEGAAYVVAEWVIPDKVLRLKGVVGYYYAGLFCAAGKCCQEPL